jgi:histidyl-tRNA synthetase
MNTQPLKGFRDFLPADAQARQWLRGQMIKVFEKWGYEPLETPTLEPAELFTGEIGEDEKLFYKFTDFGNREVMLRYDQTVPSCRVVGQYFNQLVFPFRRYQIQSSFRAENTQKGRFREFAQADIDIYGILGPEADAEAIAVTLDLYLSLGFKDVVVIINNRALMKNIPYSAVVAIDKLAKIGEAGVIKDMESKGIIKEQAEIYLNYVKNLKPDVTLTSIFKYLNDSGFSENNYRFQPTLARSFSYSDGPIWEVVIPGYSAGSVGGGERYDKLLEKYVGQNIGGTGIAFGFDRTLEACQEAGFVPAYTPPSKILVTVFSPDLITQSLNLSTALRTDGISVEVYPDPDIRLDKQLKYASKKGIPFVAILGPEEVEKGLVTLKNMSTGKQDQIPAGDVPGYTS